MERQLLGPRELNEWVGKQEMSRVLGLSVLSVCLRAIFIINLT